MKRIWDTYPLNKKVRMRRKKLISQYELRQIELKKAQLRKEVTKLTRKADILEPIMVSNIVKLPLVQRSRKYV